MTDFAPPTGLLGLFTGSGRGPAEPGMTERVIELTGKAAADVEVAYLGTPSYDSPEGREVQTGRFSELGCRVTSLDVATRAPEEPAMAETLARADVILASGGNTLYAVDRWRALGIDGMLREAIDRGAVICGGSAGAICWFDAGHSDSMDPTSYLDPAPDDDPRAAAWSYIRVDGLGFVPGLVCPHYDRTQSNGVPRAADFAQMMLRHPGETGLGIDNWAGLLVDGERYQVVYPAGQTGSLRDGRFVDDSSGAPAVWLIEVVDGDVTTRPVASNGALADILRPARSIDHDPLVKVCRAENPSHAQASLR
jgi:dipeptidase E